VGRVRHRVDAFVGVPGRELAGQETGQLTELLREVLARKLGRAPAQGRCRALIGARRPSKARIYAFGIQRRQLPLFPGSG